MIHIFTITARNYLSLALTLGQSVARHHPEARFTICVADGIDGVAMNYEHPGHGLLDARAVLPHDVFEDTAFKYNITEFCTSFKPAVFKHIFATEADIDLVYYLDPDTHLYARLDPITAGSLHKTLYLAPHLIDCRVADDHPYPEFKHLWEGIFNLGFCALRRTPAMPTVLDWWDARLREYCYADQMDGLHTDQKWMDYAPVFFHDDLQVVRHFGVNVAHWNLSERPLHLRDGIYHAGADELIFFHFSGFEFKGNSLTKHVPPMHQDSFATPLLLSFAQAYREAVHANGYEEFLATPYAFASFSDGTPVTAFHRRVYRELTKKTHFPAPFDAQGPLYRNLDRAGLLDRSPAAKANYSKATVGDLSGKIRGVERVMRLLFKLVGVRRYAQLIKLASWLGRFERHHFLVNRNA